MKIEQAFGIVLRGLREQRGLSQEDLADIAGYHRTYVSILERGLKAPTLTTISRLSDALGIAPHKLMLLAENLTHNRNSKEG